ncbi:MAG: discoidin domain-containing protein [Gemmatimonadetes bacterium]|nr:discoidin domain-containing protein [Gemmatimonadota bacterium]NNM04694.1 discoidin domain-containing protein [Gemmatimonadota bacterium]
MRTPARRQLLVAAAPLAISMASCGPQAPPLPLDEKAVLQSFDWWDNRDWDWYQENIPFFDSPDPELNETYYYRWEVLTKHLVYGSPEAGYTFTEFIDRPFWSGAYGAISCPLGHQAYEIRWLKDRRTIEDFARYWFETPGAEPRSYSNWYGDAMWATYEVLRDEALLRTVYPHMEAQVEGWTAERWDPEHRMYRWVGAWDGMETNINSRLTDDEFGGAEGYRPTLNSYLFADLLALANTAALFGEEEKAAAYRARAEALKSRVQEELWGPEREFFFHQFAFDEKDGIRAKTLTYESGPHAGDPHGRELLGYVPWQFNLPDPGYEAAWQFLMDPEYFWAPYGPTGVEQGDPQFLVSPRCCVWSGNAWPYATSQTLTALANLLNEYEQDVVSRDDYHRLLQTYAQSHRMDGRPYIAEAADPFTGSWAGHNTFYHSEHYLHSGFVDQIISGLVGIRPQPGDTLVVSPLVPEAWDYFALQGVDYHGRELTIVWDRDGSRYGMGPGFALLLDGRELTRKPELGRVTIPIQPPPTRDSGPRPNNYAVNNDGGHFPLVSASSSHPTAPPFYANDGNRWYHPSPPNRWVAGGEGPGSDWFEVDFGIERVISAVELYFLDHQRGPRVEAIGEEGGAGLPAEQMDPGIPTLPPSQFELEAWDEARDDWLVVPNQDRHPEHPEGRRSNRIDFPEVTTSRIRVVLHHRAGATSGMTELEAWGPGEIPLPLPAAPVRNLAWNPGDREYPRVSTSFTYASDAVEQAVDGRFSFTRYSRNRWTAYGSPNEEDWLEVDIGGPQAVGRVELFLYGDGAGVSAPSDYRIERWSGSSWVEIRMDYRVPATPTAWAMNSATFSQIVAERIRVVFLHALPKATGLTELRVWPN